MKTVALALSTTPLAITSQTFCKTIQVYELGSVANWPTTTLIRQAPSNTDAQEVFQAGQVMTFSAPSDTQFVPGYVVGYVSLPSGTTSGIQVEY